jgi:hypothetical protein
MLAPPSVRAYLDATDVVGLSQTSRRHAQHFRAQFRVLVFIPQVEENPVICQVRVAERWGLAECWAQATRWGQAKRLTLAVCSPLKRGLI